MKYIDEYRSRETAEKCLDDIRRRVTRPWVIMEICGGQTHTIVRYGLEDLLPSMVSLVHGPGCPVCVTPLEMIDRAIAIASRRDVIFTSFGDMLRVPGSASDLLSVRAAGGDVRIVYSPLDALKIAEENRARHVVFFAVGFETTAPANAAAVREAALRGIKNFSVLCSHVLVPPAISAILDAPSNAIQAFLAAGHVCTVTGFEEYFPLADRYRIPFVVTGFEPVDILQGIAMAVHQLEEGRIDVENQYARAVRREGNAAAKKLMSEVYEVTDRHWRGIGLIPHSGLKLRPEYHAHDAERIFDVGAITPAESSACIAGEVLRGLKKPGQCPAFGTACTPEHPLGAPMVSSEGACAAYFHYRGSASG
ncbi:MAG TPA: hydrogenase formation protein HypD [Bacteroidota bacterium]|nr:hydrogenase formation protein HypD [Bacteroidota bacterium]